MALQVLKQQASRKRKERGEAQFWQRRPLTLTLHNQAKRVVKLRYMHCNSVKRDLVDKPEDWPWSSVCHYAADERDVVEIESQWTAFQRGNLLPEHLRYNESDSCVLCSPTLR